MQVWESNDGIENCINYRGKDCYVTKVIDE